MRVDTRRRYKERGGPADVPAIVAELPKEFADRMENHNGLGYLCSPVTVAQIAARLQRARWFIDRVRASGETGPRVLYSHVQDEFNVCRDTVVRDVVVVRAILAETNECLVYVAYQHRFLIRSIMEDAPVAKRPRLIIKNTCHRKLDEPNLSGVAP
jgi:hypothetical protein